MVRDAIAADIDGIMKIYNDTIFENSVSNCHTENTDRKYWIDALANPRTVCFVMEIQREIVGWCTLKNFSYRKEYRNVREISLYVRKDFKNRCVSYILYKHLIKAAEQAACDIVVAIVLDDNITSKRLLEYDGFIPKIKIPNMAQKDSKHIDILIYTKDIN